jgi:hypothetical protein
MTVPRTESRDVSRIRPDAPDDGTIRVTATFSPGPDGIDVADVFDQLLDRLGPAKTADVLERAAKGLRDLTEGAA